jgi:hypothetical protein
MTSLPEVLKSVEWVSNIDAAFQDAKSLKKIEQILYRNAVWSKQLEIADDSNPALSFVREMQVAAQLGCAQIGLCLYKSVASSARTLVETCLYYTYFRTHPEELATLTRLDKYYVSKSEIIEYHKWHSINFDTYQKVFGLIGNIDSWYSKVSAIVHGQIPGVWNNHASLEEISFCEETHELAVSTLESAERLVHETLLCTAGHYLWASFAPDAKKFLLRGLAGDKREKLDLDLR